MPSDTRHTPAAKPTTTRAEVHVHHDDLLRHIGSGLSTPGGCCDVKEPDLSVALDVAEKLAQDIQARNGYPQPIELVQFSRSPTPTVPDS